MSENSEYLTVGEFARTMNRVEASIALGFSQTHAKQDQTNGRLLQAEKALTVLNKARLIDRMGNVEGDLRDLKGSDARSAAAASESRQRWTTRKTAIVSSCLTTASAIVVVLIKWWFHL